MMAKKYRIEMDEQDIGQVLDGLEVREESWQRTADFLETGKMPDGEFFLVEECSDAAEARWLAGRYRSIIRIIHNQMEEQK
jgi:hypothetical protein